MYTLSNPLKRGVEKSTPIKKSIREVFMWMIISATQGLITYTSHKI